MAHVVGGCRASLRVKGRLARATRSPSPVASTKYAARIAHNPYGIFRGLNLDDEILRKVYVTNVDKLFGANR